MKSDVIFPYSHPTQSSRLEDLSGDNGDSDDDDDEDEKEIDYD